MCIYFIDGDNSVLNLLEKSIEPVDETSFVSSILNSGKVIQLTGMKYKLLMITKKVTKTSLFIIIIYRSWYTCPRIYKK